MLNPGFTLTALLVFATAAVLTRVVMRLGIHDVHDRRWSHERSTPSGAGVAIAAAFTVGVTVLYGTAPSNPGAGVFPDEFVAFAALAAVVAAAAFLDDLFGLPPVSKLLPQCAAACLFAVYIAHIEMTFIPGVGQVSLGLWGYGLTVLWIVFFMNAFNFMDGIDGISGGAAVIAAVFVGVIAFGENARFVVILCLCLGPAVTGFLIFNFPRARVFMGDAGSQFIGFVLASLSVFGQSGGSGRLSVYLVPVILYPFIFDVVVTLFHRALRGRNILMAHREHLYQIAVRLGAGHVHVSLAYFVLFALGGALALGVQAAGPGAGLLVAAALFPVYCVMAGVIYRRAVRARVIEPVFGFTADD